jgi:hypothetical protein
VGAGDPQRSPAAAEDARARAAFAALEPGARRDVVDLLALYMEHSGTLQSALIAAAKRRQDRDPASWKVFERPAFYDPEVHAPGQPIPRHWLDADSDAVRAARKQILARCAPRPWTRGFLYDWKSGELVRVKSADEPARVFENALAGFAPDLDLVEALVERDLDDRSFAAEADAFGRAYTDRAGGVYPGLTLYDAYASGTEFEMPDVDVLGIVHALFPAVDQRWTAPIPSTQHDVLYPQVGERFSPYYRHRALRTALARTFAVGDAVLDDGYASMLDNFHALWEDCASLPETLRGRLPKPAGRDEFLAAWTARCQGPDSMYPAGQARHKALASEAPFVRASVIAALRELGALADEPVKSAEGGTDRPAPKSPDKSQSITHETK